MNMIRSDSWIWVRNQPSLDRLAGHDQDFDLISCLFDIIFKEGPLEPPQPFLITGGLASEREQRRPGSGELLFATPGREPLGAILDFWGIYAPAPLRFVTSLMEILQCHYSLKQP